MLRGSGLMIRLAFLSVIVGSLLALLLSEGALAQEAAAPAQSAPDAAKEAAAKAEAAKAKDSKSEEKPSQNGEAAKSEGKKDGEPKEGESKDDEPAVVKRPDKWEGPSTVDQLPTQVGPDGEVQFNVQGVPWPELLQWLAEVSKLSLDWQELPGDFPNIRTQRGYTISEAQDVINRHLLARGYTMLKQGELLTVANIQKMNQGLVPRVNPEELEERMPHEFVKVSFPLDWMLADSAAEELKPMLSPNGKLTPLSSTNRLEAMDAVVNLREIHRLLTEEQTGPGQESLVAEIKLKHVRARDILPLVQKVVGIEDHSGVTGDVSDGSARQIMQQLQQIQQMQQQAQRNSGSSGGSGGKGGDDQKPKLIINERENSIVVHASPDKMEIIRQTIVALDTPSRRDGHLLANPHNLKVHRLSTLDPAPLVSILNELGDLSPDTKIEVDTVNKSLIVYGSLADQVTVQTLVDKLDGSTRNFQVKQLRRLRAEDVAGTIMYMLGEEEEDKNSNSSPYFSYYSSRYSNFSQQQEEKRPFRVDADIDNNRLLLWANEVELAEVENLLEKMGEISGGTNSTETMRVLDFSTEEDAEQILERIRRLWPNIAPNELEIQTQPQTREDQSEAPLEEPTASATVPAADGALIDLRIGFSDINGVRPQPMVARSEGHQSWRGPATHLGSSLDDHSRSPVAFNSQPEGEAADGDDDVVSEEILRPQQRRIVPTRTTPGGAPPIMIQRGPNGRLILGSPDTDALNQLEDLIADLTPKRRDFVIFKLTHPSTFAYDVEYNLKAFFETETEGKPVRDWYGFLVNQKDDSGNRLSRRKPLKIIGDEVSRTILVQGATQDQLRTIEELIEIYDQPEADNPQMMRVTQVFTVQYSNASVVAEAIKDAYRDLLSPNDPAFEKKNGEERSQGTATTITYDYGSRYGNDKDDDLPQRPEPIRFKGALSMGVDEVSNTIVVSAARGLLLDIGLLIKELDELAKPSNNIRVVPVSPGLNLSALQERMTPVLTVTRPQKNGANGNQNGAQQGNENGNNSGGNNAGFSR